MGNKLLFYGTYIEIQCDRNDIDTAELASQIPYIHSNRILTQYRTTVRNIDLVLKLFRGVDVTNIEQTPPYVQQLFDKEMRRRITTKTLLELGPTYESNWLRKHQCLGVELAEINDRFGFFYDTRTGKTPMSLQIIANDIEKNPYHKWLVLCPLILIENAWLEDHQKFFPHIPMVSLHAATKEKRLARFATKASIYVQNIESFASYRKYIEKLGVYGCFVDESSTMKSGRSIFGKEAVDFSIAMDKWYLLSGSPAPNGEWEYYRQLQSIDKYGVHSSWTQFKNYFFIDVSRNPQYEKLQVRPDRHDELIELLKRYSLYVDKEDVLTTPGRDFNEYTFKLPEDVKQQYKQLKNELYLELGNNVLITVPSTAAKLNKLNQVSSGFIIDTAAMKRNKAYKAAGMLPEEIETYLLNGYRFDKLYDFLQERPGEQAIIWCNYHEEFKVIQQMLGAKCRCVYGGISIDEKTENIKAFKEKRVQYLVANPASADKGLTLTNTHIAIYFSMNYSYELWKQSIERIYGDISIQPNRCEYYVFIAEGTIDKVIYDTVMQKGDMSKAILNHLKGVV